MTRVVPTPAMAHAALAATVRYQLREAWERGMATAPHGIHSLADDDAPASYRAIMAAVDELTTAVATVWAARNGCPPLAGGQ